MLRWAWLPLSFPRRRESRLSRVSGGMTLIRITAQPLDPRFRGDGSTHKGLLSCSRLLASKTKRAPTSRDHQLARKIVFGCLIVAIQRYSIRPKATRQHQLENVSMKYSMCIFFFLSIALCEGAVAGSPRNAKEVSREACVGVDFIEDFSPQSNSDVRTKFLADREKICLSELPKSASREGDFLTLNLENGGTKIYQSRNDAYAENDAEHCVQYLLVDYRSRFFVIWAAFYESHQAYLVDARTGKCLSGEMLNRMSHL
jgi:hypothetical protein